MISVPLLTFSLCTSVFSSISQNLFLQPPERAVKCFYTEGESDTECWEKDRDVPFNRCPTWLLAAVHCGQFRSLWVLPLLWISACVRKKAAGSEALAWSWVICNKIIKSWSFRFLYPAAKETFDLLSVISFYIKCTYSICDIRMHIECYLLKVFGCVFPGLLADNTVTFTLQYFFGAKFFWHWSGKYQS